MAAYAGTAELARVLEKRRPTVDELVAMERVLDAAAYEIDYELQGGSATYGSLWYGTPYPALVVEVNLERAVEHWSQGYAPFGIVGMGEATPTMTGKDPFDRHAAKLAPLKATWGIA